MTTKQAREHLQAIPAEILALAAAGHLDLNALAADELASRGLDLGCKWVGHERARAIADEAKAQLGC